jgi:hypothetical protein
MSSAFEAKKFEQDHFIEAIGSALEEAAEPGLVHEDSEARAQVIVTKLDQVANGEVVVEPPLSDQQLASYNTAALGIINLAQNTSRELTIVARSRRGLIDRIAGRPGKALVPGVESRRAAVAVFQGNGSAAKD